MHTILQRLVMLQDLDCMISEVASKDGRKIQKKMGLTVKGEEKLQEAKEALEQSIPPAVLFKYHKLMKRFGRAVAPVVDSSCMGCYVMVPKRLTLRRVTF